MIHVLIADRTRFICGFMRSILDKYEDFYVIGCASEVEELHFLLPQCNVALISAQFKGEETIDLIRELRTKCPYVKCVVVGVPDLPARIVRYIEAGAAGYILENESPDDLIHKVKAAANGQALVSGKVAAVMMKQINSLANSPPSLYDKKEGQTAVLTLRQREVMDLVSKGLTNKEIANRLYIECGTVKNHLHHILKKIGASNRHEAASIYRMYYHENGFTANERYHQAAEQLA